MGASALDSVALRAPVLCQIHSALACYHDHQNEVEEEIARVENDGSFTFR